MTDSKPKIVIIVGPTAGGKSRMALHVAERFNGEIINADSVQIYRHMDIGTAKPSRDDRERITHHLVDIRDPDEDFDAAKFREEASKAIDEIVGRGRLPIVAGGTGLYIKALTEGLFDVPESDKELRVKLKKESEAFGLSYLYEKLKEADPESADKIGPFNTHRIIRALEVFYLTGVPMSKHQKEHAFSDKPYDCLKIGLFAKRVSMYKRIDARVNNMIQDGLSEEVGRLLKIGYSPDLKALQALGYRQICDFLRGGYNIEDAVDAIKKETRHYAKRQMTWFKRDHEIVWFDTEEEGCLERVFNEIGRFVG